MDWQQLFFSGWEALLRTVVAATLSYIGLIIMLRISGKRSLAKLNVFDFVVTVALGSTLATILLSQDVALAEGMTAFIMLIGLQWLVARWSIASRPFRRAIRSSPRVLVKNGHYLEDCIHAERLTKVEVDEAIRKSGYGDSADIAWVVLETDGSFSIISRDKAGAGGTMESVPDQTVDRHGGSKA